MSQLPSEGSGLERAEEVVSSREGAQYRGALCGHADSAIGKLLLQLERWYGHRHRLDYPHVQAIHDGSLGLAQEVCARLGVPEESGPKEDGIKSLALWSDCADMLSLDPPSVFLVSCS